MKILVPTDFSEESSNAFKVAIELASIHNASIHIYHNLGVAENWDLSQRAVKNNIEIPALVEESDNLLQSWGDMARDWGVPVTASYSGGDLEAHLSEHISEMNISLMVLGAKSEAHFEQKFISSNTQALLKKLHCPILTVKSPITPVAFNSVVYLSNFDAKDEPAFRRFLTIVKPFDPYVHLLAIDLDSSFAQPAIVMKKAMEKFRAIAAPHRCEINFHRAASVTAGLSSFCADKQIKLVGISNKFRHPVKRIFKGSNVEKIIADQDLPVLTIDY